MKRQLNGAPRSHWYGERLTLPGYRFAYQWGNDFNDKRYSRRFWIQVLEQNEKGIDSVTRDDNLPRAVVFFSQAQPSLDRIPITIPTAEY